MQEEPHGEDRALHQAGPGVQQALLRRSRGVRRIDIVDDQRPDAMNLYDVSSAVQEKWGTVLGTTATRPAGNGFVFDRSNFSPTPMFNVPLITVTCSIPLPAWTGADQRDNEREHGG